MNGPTRDEAKKSFGSEWSSAAWTISGSASWWALLSFSLLADLSDEFGLYAALAAGSLAFVAVRYAPIDPNRVLGLIVPASVPTFGSLVLALAFGPSRAALAALGIGLFAIVSAVSRHRSESDRIQSRTGKRFRVFRTGDFVLLAAVIGTVAAHFAFRALSPEPQSHAFDHYRYGLAIGIALLLFAFTWIRLFRPFFELCVEAVVSQNYRVISVGPSATDLPLNGPLIVIANHACWWDPLFLAKKLSRPTTPMMTSIFYDKWFIKPLVKYVFGAIRVEDARVRREAPEIQEAIRALDDGKCLVLFPEAFLRRKEEVPLRRFGRGIWEILKARPDTPVVCCWIEGAWGSYSSFWNGPPTKNKVKERRRPIAIGMSAPVTVPVEKLERHLATRISLMNEVSAARTHLGLPPLPTFELPAKDDEAAPEQPA